MSDLDLMVREGAETAEDFFALGFSSEESKAMEEIAKMASGRLLKVTGF